MPRAVEDGIRTKCGAERIPLERNRKKRAGFRLRETCPAWRFEVGFFKVCICFVFGCAGSRLLCRLLSSCSEREATLAACGLRSCGSWVLEYRLSSLGTQAQLLCSM